MSIPVQVDGVTIQLVAEPLTREAFAPFGEVVDNPRPNLLPATYAAQGGELPFNGISANQGTAIRYANVSRPRSYYAQSPSGKGELIMSQFVCATRQLAPTGDPLVGEFTVDVLERHPYTSQTFAPLNSTASKYLVIAAPSLPPAPADESLPVPSGDALPGRGLPDLRGLKAFVATNKQAVTYAACTWHAPMASLGQADTTLDFLVVQYASGVAVEDCQYATFETKASGGPNIKVKIPITRDKLEKL